VLIAFEDLKARPPSSPRVSGWVTRTFAGHTIGYGYRPLGAVWQLIAITGIGWVIYRRNYVRGNMVPTDKDEYDKAVIDGRLSEEYSRFSPLMFSLENSLPLVKLGQVDKWKVREGVHAPRIKVGKSRPSRYSLIRTVQKALIAVGLLAGYQNTETSFQSKRLFSSPVFLRWFLWFKILLGWLLATLFVAGVSGLIHSK
jgi:hypothetical protein